MGRGPEPIPVTDPTSTPRPNRAPRETAAAGLEPLAVLPVFVPLRASAWCWRAPPAGRRGR